MARNEAYSPFFVLKSMPIDIFLTADSLFFIFVFHLNIVCQSDCLFYFSLEQSASYLLSPSLR